MLFPAHGNAKAAERLIAFPGDRKRYFTGHFVRAINAVNVLWHLSYPPEKSPSMADDFRKGFQSV